MRRVDGSPTAAEGPAWIFLRKPLSGGQRRCQEGDRSEDTCLAYISRRSDKGLPDLARMFHLPCRGGSTFTGASTIPC